MKNIVLLKDNSLEKTLAALRTPGVKAVFSNYLCGCCSFGDDLIWHIAKSDAKVIGGISCGDTCLKQVEEAGKVFALFDQSLVNNETTIEQIVENAIIQKTAHRSNELTHEITKGYGKFSFDMLANAKAVNAIKELSFYSDYPNYSEQEIYFNGASAKGFAIVDHAKNAKGFAVLTFGLGDSSLEYTSPIAKSVEKEFLKYDLHLDLSRGYGSNMWLDIYGKMEGFPNSEVPGNSWYVYSTCNGKKVRYSLHGDKEENQKVLNKISAGVKEIKAIPELIKSKVLG